MSGSVDLGGRRIIKKIFFKQKTAYEIVTGDWSSDVCSSDLATITEQGNSKLFFIGSQKSQRSQQLHPIAPADVISDTL